MRYGQIILRLQHCQPEPVSRKSLAAMFSVSARTLSTDIRMLNNDGKHHGFAITTVRGQGYTLTITNKVLFESYCRQLNKQENYSPEFSQRLNNLEMLLLLADGYITLEEISRRLKVSIPTVKTDIKRTQPFFSGQQLEVVGQPHHGIYVEGKEVHKRQAIMTLFRMRLPAPVVSQEYQEFVQTLDEQQLREFLLTRMRKHRLSINDALLKNVIEHVRLLIFRMTRKNYITTSRQNELVAAPHDNRVEVLVEAIVDYIQQYYEISLPDIEILDLYGQMLGKLSYVAEQDEVRYRKMINHALARLDQMYRTHFADDEELKASLLIHVATLSKRLSTNHQLQNPLLDEIYTRYANVINTSIDFMQLMLPDKQEAVSKDELGYIAIYFAASLEKQKVEEMKDYKKVIVLTDNGRGVAYLLESGLHRLFPNAVIKTSAVNEINNLDPDADLIVSTVNAPNLPKNTPAIEISQILSDRTLNRVEEDVHLLREDPTHFVSSQDQILSLFQPSNFQIIETGGYLEILRQRGALMESDHVARPGYTDSVIFREKQINTVYERGIAGPHPMSSFANQERIDVTLIRESILYAGKQVRLIFLINLGQGHLVLHQEISRMMIALMNDDSLLNALDRVQSYSDFIGIIKAAINRR